MINVQLKFTSDPVLTATNLRMSLQKRGMIRAIRACIQPVKQAVIQAAGAIKRYGFLQQSIGQKIKAYSNTVIAVIGPTAKFKRRKGVVKRGKHKGKPIFHAPSNYAHLLEKGTVRSRPRPFLAPALTQTSANYSREVGQRIGIEIEAELAKVKK